jgi:hypothetical protein
VFSYVDYSTDGRVCKAGMTPKTAVNIYTGVW